METIGINLYGAEEGTRTPTPLRVHGPEPCASANSATSASDYGAGDPPALKGRDCNIYSYKARNQCQTSAEYCLRANNLQRRVKDQSTPIDPCPKSKW